MIIILDTSIIGEDFRMRGVNFQALFEALDGDAETRLKLRTPNVVVAETMNRYRKRLLTVQKSVNDALRDFKRLTSEELVAPITDEMVNAEALKYTEWLLEFLNEGNKSILPYPKITHEEVVHWDLARKKPFSTEGKGYRDFLIWSTLVEASLATDEQIVFATQNLRDFAGNRDQPDILHRDLIENLVSKHIDTVRVVLVASLSDLVDQFVKPELHRAEVITKLQDDAPEFSYLSQSILEYLQEHAEAYSVNIEEIRIEEEFEAPNITEIVQIRNVTYVDAIELPTSGHILLTGELDAQCWIDVYLAKANIYMLDEEEVSISDPDWNDHYMEAQIERVLRFSFRLTFDPVQEQVVALDLVPILAFKLEEYKKLTNQLSSNSLEV